MYYLMLLSFFLSTFFFCMNLINDEWVNGVASGPIFNSTKKKVSFFSLWVMFMYDCIRLFCFLINKKDNGDNENCFIRSSQRA